MNNHGFIRVAAAVPAIRLADPAYNAEEICRLIDKAIEECNRLGIKGKETTPFLLAKVKEITGGDSLDSNIQLVFNNAKVAALTAVELCK